MACKCRSILSKKSISWKLVRERFMEMRENNMVRGLLNWRTDEDSTTKKKGEKVKPKNLCWN